MAHDQGRDRDCGLARSPNFKPTRESVSLGALASSPASSPGWPAGRQRSQGKMWMVCPDVLLVRRSPVGSGGRLLGSVTSGREELEAAGVAIDGGDEVYRVV